MNKTRRNLFGILVKQFLVMTGVVAVNLIYPVTARIASGMWMLPADLMQIAIQKQQYGAVFFLCVPLLLTLVGVLYVFQNFRLFLKIMFRNPDTE